jgi:thiazole synthase
VANTESSTSQLTIAETVISSRFWLGSSDYPSPDIMGAAFAAANPGFVTVSLRRQTAGQVKHNDYRHRIEEWLASSRAKLLPNTAGATSAKEAIHLAVLARELFNTQWIKLEVIGDDYSLQPDVFELVAAAKELQQQGFSVLPYCTDDLGVCEKLLSLGCPAVMPLAAPIGTGKGLLNPYQFQTLRSSLKEAVIVIDAGIGRPSQAMQAMELGADAVLLNTAVAKSNDPVAMASAFASAIEAGRRAYLAGVIPERDRAVPSTPNAGLPFWHQSAP